MSEQTKITQTIQSQDIKIADVFQSFYVVPDYQREYVWGTDEVEQLLTDINGELAGADPKKAPEYFRFIRFLHTQIAFHPTSLNFNSCSA